MSQTRVQSPEPKSNRWINVTVQIPEELYSRMKRVMQKRGYRTIAEFIRDLVREKVEKEERE